MRVVGVVPNYPPQSRVGAWLATHGCLARLVERGHDVSVFRTARCEPYTLDGVAVWPSGPAADEAVKDADVVVSHLGDDNRAAASAEKWRRPVVRMVHGVVPDHVERLSRHGAPALVVYNSEASRSAMPWPGESIVVHPPFDREAFATSRGDLVTLVNLCEAKGAGLFERLSRSMPDRAFLGVRGGYGHQVGFRKGRNITVTPTTQNMRDDVFARTRVLLMPSLHETWGMVGVEAMCSGIPVIAHPTPGLVESLGSAGIFVDRDDGQGWVDAIVRLDKPGNYRAASKAALARVDELEAEDGRDRFCEALEALT